MRAATSRPLEGFSYWPPCPECGSPVGCYGRTPKNSVPAQEYLLRCNDFGHSSMWKHAELAEGQETWLAHYRRKYGSEWPDIHMEPYPLGEWAQ